MDSTYDLMEVLNHIDPSELSYQDWINVGMALQHEGYSVDVWDRWSMNDRRYHAGECEKKWRGFHGAGTPVTGGTIVQYARDQGWTPPYDPGTALDWNDTISAEGIIVDKNWVEEREVTEPRQWDPAGELIKYLETLFEAGENVGYVVKSWKKDEKYLPADKGSYGRTAGQLIELLSQCKGDIGSVLGDYNPEGGAWIRFNPLDGKGVKNENVSDFKYALVESDSMEIEKQHAIIRELELPVACLVHSGGKSLHAIVRVDAADYSEYRKRVDYLYDICKKNGLAIDQQNRNPSRLSRLPGIMRGDKKQFIVDTNIGKESWTEWKEWIESINDDLPDPESLDDVWENLPELAPTLIDGLLRQGHKMLIAGPSKAGKSFLQIEMCIAIAEGKQWLNWACTQGRVMYVNLELDRASCLHRFKDVYQALGWQPKNLKNIDIWNLRGKSRPMDKLAPMLIRRAAKKNYIAIVIDPIYKVITGDENSADQMSNFCNQFDKVCTELGVAVIYCHHHSKGSQGGKKSMDRASGSGVFARDPDALIDLIELETTEELMKQQENRAVCDTCRQYLDAHFKWEDDLSQDDLCSSYQMMEYCKEKLDKWQMAALERNIEAAKSRVKGMTAWRIEGTLREFSKFDPVNLWFNYPVHTLDQSGVLGDIQPEADAPSWKKNFSKKKSPEESKKERKESLETQYESLKSFNEDGKVTIKDLAEGMGTTEKTVRNRIKEHGGFWIDEGYVGRK
ncbi:AAA family ATPase [Lacrimispora saccharolytica]|uniref:Primase 2 n=1 Tax=Lacrimispora saccharolytica (strain ATCC 35040 / DSM 2544 / NRCC 2533 / WM1) TaxID=610130 RepID=D9R8Z7_LACSW|nr:AAA family ATPase [Lacrimispora saccharolytica]ADL03972.1 Primase 2 [[Clostridium] saccharolyticum WM1]QRV21722.1 AAA family ATPase [Lacrimispora saccharolytica]